MLVPAMCKHVAASLYGVGARLDESPELLFVLRGVEATELVVDGGAARAITGQARDKALGADTAELADLFGIDMSAGRMQPEAGPVEVIKPLAALDAPPASVQPKSGVRRKAPSIWSLERQREVIERRLEELKSTIAVALGPEQQRVIGRFGIKTAGLVHSMKVPWPGLVPAEFMSQQPNRKAILMHFHQTGEVVAGTTMTTRRPAVRVWEVEEKGPG